MPYAIEVSGELVGITAIPFHIPRLRVAEDEAAHYEVSAGTIIDCDINCWDLPDRLTQEDRDRYLIQTVAQSPEDAESQQLAAAQAQYDIRRQSPMSWDFGSVDTLDDLGVSQGAAGVQTLQMRDEDQTNWLGAAQAAVLLLGPDGSGASTTFPLKATSNFWVQTTAAQVLAVLAEGDGAQVSALLRKVAMLRRYGLLKAQIKAASTAEAKLAIDVTAGWPN